MNKKIFFSLGAGLFTGLLLIVIFLQILGLTWKQSVIFESCQGDYIKYGSYDPYCLSIIKQNQPLNSNYVILVSRKDDKNYGHILNYIDPDPLSEDEIKNSRVIWSVEGIEVTFPAGHKLYIPKESFTGGR
ncbi:MAG: hypothetical protein L0Y79_09720 [Chlorobi bacterium]|nr:hypothetical protein [Chlorobiota bacterium]MCI0715863.1 hypothetical protein [Chlorobiota bacterium]